MRMEIATAPGDPDRPNEDFVSTAAPASGQGGTLVVLDGVTPPSGDYGCRHTVPWFTARLGGALGELSVSRTDLTLREVLSHAIRRTADAHRQLCDLSHVRTPQATVVLARWDETRIEYLVLSDSVLLVEHVDGGVEAVLDDRLDRAPREVLRSTDATDATLRNKEGGFFTAAADPEVSARAVTGALPRASVRSLAALTDGASRWVERFRSGTWAECLDVLAKQGPQALIDQVRAAEHAQGRPASGKQHDDATAAYVIP
ncbi:protein phosphatase 2C domain-containing protein [Streptomyces sp. NPDC059578]|uniref:protein phosphatase 2C domain-containing protein n=1 Tax=unclassified Streptomyces TaxID=2593676 RepID=UPI00365493E8